jgi:hypothetical protein
MSVWKIEQDREGGGRIARTTSPRFSAQWRTGDDVEEMAALPGPCWSDAGSGSGEDAIHVYGFVWSGGAPDQAAFEALMREAAREIDAWIVERL